MHCNRELSGKETVILWTGHFPSFPGGYLAVGELHSLMGRWRREQRLVRNSIQGGRLCCTDWRTRKGWVNDWSISSASVLWGCVIVESAGWCMGGQYNDWSLNICTITLCGSVTGSAASKFVEAKKSLLMLYRCLDLTSAVCSKIGGVFDTMTYFPVSALLCIFHPHVDVVLLCIGNLAACLISMLRL